MHFDGSADRLFHCDFVSCFFVLFSVCSFGNAALDERSILAPLYQCCMWVKLDDLFIHYYILLFIYMYVFDNLSCQGSCVHVEQDKPAKKWSSEFSYAAGSGIRPYSPCPGRATPHSPGQASVWCHSNCQTVHGDTGSRQYSNRGPNEPPPSLERDKGQILKKPRFYFPSLESRDREESTLVFKTKHSE